MSSESNRIPRLELASGDIETIQFRLYVAGASPNSTRAIANLTHFFETRLNAPYNLEIIDIHQQPLIAKSDQIIALPLLVKTNPGPERRLIGDMSDTEKIIKGLGLVPAME